MKKVNGRISEKATRKIRPRLLYKSPAVEYTTFIEGVEEVEDLTNSEILRGAYTSINDNLGV